MRNARGAQRCLANNVPITDQPGERLETLLRAHMRQQPQPPVQLSLGAGELTTYNSTRSVRDNNSNALGTITSRLLAGGQGLC